MKLLKRHSAPRSVSGTSVLSRAMKAPHSSFWRRPWVLIALAGLMVGFLVLSAALSDRDATVAEQQTDTTQAQLGAVADPLAELCRTDPSVRARVGDAACGLAQQAVDNPEIPVPGPQGDPGVAGRGIVSTTLVGGNLVVVYSDGARENVGAVVGADGATGPAGVGITGSQIADGHLVLSFSDGTTRDVGVVVGPAGIPGADGENGSDGANGLDGRGITSVAQEEGRLVITFTDGSTQDLGPLPAGPAGEKGADGSPATTLVLEGAGPLGADLTCQRSNDDPVAPIYTCS